MGEQITSSCWSGKPAVLVDSSGSIITFVLDSLNRISIPVDTEVTFSGTLVSTPFMTSGGSIAPGLIDSSRQIILSPSSTITASPTGTQDVNLVGYTSTLAIYGFSNSSSTLNLALIDSSRRVIMSPSSTITASSPELLATSVQHIYSNVSTTSTLFTSSLTTIYGSIIKNIGSNPMYVTWGTADVTSSTLMHKLQAGEFISQSPYSWNKFAAICDAAQSSTIIISINGIA